MADVKVTIKADLQPKEAQEKLNAFKAQADKVNVVPKIQLDTSAALNSFNNFLNSIQGKTVTVKLETNTVSTQDSTNARKKQQERLLRSLPSARTLSEARAQIQTDNLVSRANRAGVDVSAATSAMSQLTSATQRLGNVENITASQSKALTNAKNEQATAFAQATATVKQAEQAQREQAKAQHEQIQAQNMQVQAQKRLADMRIKESQWSKMMANPDAAAEYRSMIAQFESYANGDGTVEGLKQLNAQSRAFEANMKAVGLATKSWGDSFKQTIGLLGTLFSAQKVFSMLQSGAATVKQNVTEINTAMTDLRKVTEATEGQYDHYLESAGKRAVDLSATVDGYIAGTTGFARAGYLMKEAQGLGEWANIYYNVGDGVASVDDATGSLIATMKAFKKSAADAGHVVDTFNKLGNNYAVESGNLGTIMEGSASALSSAGASFEETAAMGTAMYEINRNASKTASTLKTVSLRMRGAKAELISMGEDTDGMAESTSKLREQILALTNIDGKGGFDILTDTGDFKNFYDMMDGISEKWVQMDKSSTNAAALLELMSGKVRASDLAALLDNFDTAREALLDATNSEGSAMEEYSKWQNSIEAKQKKINAQTQKLSISLVDDGTLASAYDIFSGILSVVTSITDALGGWTSIVTALSPILLKAFPQLGTAYVQHAPLRENPVAA